MWSGSTTNALVVTFTHARVCNAQPPAGLPPQVFLEQYADGVVSQLLEISQRESSAMGSLLVVCGHSIYTNAIAYRIAQGAGFHSELAFTNKLAETDGFYIPKLEELPQDPDSDPVHLLSELKLERLEEAELDDIDPH